ncbi:unnamed protein product [Thlaspi arvense]|uniref:FBD domain-containing protein n=1 Tax=Thlaspi arvense TaxID=13288 RepID=A0AAU9SQZ7_THLAR|nr:unnamed protein product [Thlaspi arvense]
MCFVLSTFLLCEYSKLEPLPRFGDMSRLHISLRVTDLKWLTTFLESFPNLKSLVLVCDDDYEKMNETSFSTVPECLPLSLEFVDFEIPISGHVGEMKLVREFGSPQETHSNFGGTFNVRKAYSQGTPQNPKSLYQM